MSIPPVKTPKEHSLVKADPLLSVEWTRLGQIIDEPIRMRLISPVPESRAHGRGKLIDLPNLEDDLPPAFVISESVFKDRGSEGKKKRKRCFEVEWSISTSTKTFEAFISKFKRSDIKSVRERLADTYSLLISIFRFYASRDLPTPLKMGANQFSLFIHESRIVDEDRVQ